MPNRSAAVNHICERRRVGGARWYTISFVRLKREVWAGITPASRALDTIKAAWQHGKTVTVGQYEYRHRSPEAQP